MLLYFVYVVHIIHNPGLTPGMITFETTVKFQAKIVECLILSKFYFYAWVYIDLLQKRFFSCIGACFGRCLRQIHFPKWQQVQPVEILY